MSDSDRPDSSKTRWIATSKEAYGHGDTKREALQNMLAHTQTNFTTKVEVIFVEYTGTIVSNGLTVKEPTGVFVQETKVEIDPQSLDELSHRVRETRGKTRTLIEDATVTREYDNFEE